MTKSDAKKCEIHLVVIDDIARFAVHLCRYFRGPINMSVGQVKSDPPPEDYFFEKKYPDRPKYLATGQPQVKIWWLPAKGERWEGPLCHILNSVGQNDRVFFYIDVYGKVENKPDQPEIDYDFQRVLSFIKSKIESKFVIQLITSYENEMDHFFSNGLDPEVEILPKSPATFRSIRKKALAALEIREAGYWDLKRPRVGFGNDRSRKEGVSGNQMVHVLVTGAGFEVKNLEEQEFGVRRISDLIKTVFAISRPSENKKDLDKKPRPTENEKGEEGFLLPYSESSSELRNAAENKNLDLYWDLLIERECEIQRSLPSELKRSEIKIQIHKQTQRLRNAFRQAILRDDWGMMRQSLDAGRLPWHAWLTTNYTRFADRAIRLSQRHLQLGGTAAGQDLSPTAHWRTVSTATEASILIHELLFGARQSIFSNPDQAQSLLFKLHGDISHLHTMAISGQDKELFNTSGLPLGPLSLIYQAAQGYLQALALQIPKNCCFHWHIVGHGLEDQLLLETIWRVSQVVLNGGGCCRYTVVSPGGPKKILDRLKDFKAEDQVWFIPKKCIGVPKKENAFVYLARLRSGGLAEV